jgi:polyisoprenoid-binding protein YceI
MPRAPPWQPVTSRRRSTGEKLGYRTGFEASVTIKRSDFGMKYGIDMGALGDEVKLILAIEGIRQ